MLSCLDEDIALLKYSLFYLFIDYYPFQILLLSNVKHIIKLNMAKINSKFVNVTDIKLGVIKWPQVSMRRRSGEYLLSDLLHQGGE